MATEQVLSLQMTNMFSFVCPIFDSEVQFRSCVLVRDKVYAGKQIETRRGCQACVSASKCPAAEIVRRFAFGSSDMTDHCSSIEPKVGKLPVDVLERINLVLVSEQTLAAYGVGAAERDLITTSRTRIEAQMPSAQRGAVAPKVTMRNAAPPTPRQKPKEAQMQIEPVNTTINNAAATGNLAAALNAE